MTDYFDQLALAGLFNSENVAKAAAIPDGALADNAVVTGAVLKQWINQHAAALDPVVFVKPNRAAFALMLKVQFIKGQIGNTRPLATSVAPGFVYMDTGNADALSWSDSVAWRGVSATDTLLDIALFSLRNRLDSKVGIEIIDQLKGEVASGFDTLGEVQTLIQALQASVATKLTTTDLQTALTDKAISIGQVSGLGSALGQKVDSTQKGALNGVATLDGSGKVPSAQLPSYVDDVIEVANYAALPGTGVVSAIYVTLNDNKQYRWGGSAYIELTSSPGTTDAVPEGSTNKYFTDARAQSALTSALAGKQNTLTGVTGVIDPATGAARAILASDVPALAISKTTGLQAALDAKLDDSQVVTSTDSQNDSGAIATTAWAKFASRKDAEFRGSWYNIDKTGVTACSAQIATIMSEIQTNGGGRLKLGPGKYKWDSEVPLLQGVSLEGPNVGMFSGVFANVSPQLIGKGAIIEWSDTALTPFYQPVNENGGELRNLIFNQAKAAIPGSGVYAPTVYPPAIQLFAGGMILKDLLFFGCHRGIEVGIEGAGSGLKLGGYVGRGLIEGISGEFFDYGIAVRQCGDRMRINGFHQYVFWSNWPTPVRDWCRENTTGIRLERCDNLQMSNGFAFGVKYGVHLKANTRGATRELMMSNHDFDATKIGLYVENSGHSAQIVNFGNQPGPDANMAGSCNVLIDGGFNDIEITNIRGARAHAGLIRLNGGSNTLGICNLRGDRWDDTETGTVPAIYNADSTNIINLSGKIRLRPDATQGPVLGAASGAFGSFRWPEAARGTVSATTNGSGEITVTHDLGFNPLRILIQGRTDFPFMYVRTAVTATTFTVKVKNATTGADAASSAVVFDWIAGM